MRDLFTWVALAVAIGVPDRAEAGCRGGRLFGRRHNTCGNATNAVANCSPASAQCAPAGYSFAQPAYPVAHAVGRALTAPVRALSPKCGPGGCP